MRAPRRKSVRDGHSAEIGREKETPATVPLTHIALMFRFDAGALLLAAALVVPSIGRAQRAPAEPTASAPITNVRYEVTADRADAIERREHVDVNPRQ